jgi:hypothetical protein
MFADMSGFVARAEAPVQLRLIQLLLAAPGVISILILTGCASGSNLPGAATPAATISATGPSNLASFTGAISGRARISAFLRPGLCHQIHTPGYLSSDLHARVAGLSLHLQMDVAGFAPPLTAVVDPGEANGRPRVSLLALEETPTSGPSDRVWVARGGTVQFDASGLSGRMDASFQQRTVAGDFLASKFEIHGRWACDAESGT